MTRIGLRACFVHHHAYKLGGRHVRDRSPRSSFLTPALTNREIELFLGANCARRVGHLVSGIWS